jgi:Protein of unknown function (DUF2889)
VTPDPDRAPGKASGPLPVRRPWSVRRTSSIDTSWPEGRGGPMRMQASARDMVMGDPIDPAHFVDTASYELLASPAREILSISSDSSLDGQACLVGVRGGGQSRASIEALIEANACVGKPIHLLLDDFAGASLVAGWAWSRWTDTWAQPASVQNPAVRLPKMEGICAGFRPGASSLTPEGRPRHDIQSSTPVPPLSNPEDPEGWHAAPNQEGVAMRRARWIDAWIDDGAIRIEAGFQDSATDPGGGRVAVHEYLVSALVDVHTGNLITLSADPRILPYRECPAAVGNISRMIGLPVATFRASVLAELPGTLGCTHLNDVLRALADVPYLGVMLQRHTPPRR